MEVENIRLTRSYRNGYSQRATDKTGFAATQNDAHILICFIEYKWYSKQLDYYAIFTIFDDVN